MECEPLSLQILAAAVQVHRALGAGYHESVYANALCVALVARGIPHSREHVVDLYFGGVPVGTHRLDLLVDNAIVVALKAVEKLLEVHKAQTRSYLKATNKKVGLLLNFDAPVLDIKRFVHTPTTKWSFRDTSRSRVLAFSRKVHGVMTVVCPREVHGAQYNCGPCTTHTPLVAAGRGREYP